MRQRILLVLALSVFLTCILIGLPKTNDSKHIFPEGIQLHSLKEDRLLVPSDVEKLRLWDANFNSIDLNFKYASTILNYIDKSTAESRNANGIFYNLNEKSKSNRVLSKFNSVFISTKGILYSTKKSNGKLSPNKQLYNFNITSLNNLKSLEAYIKAYKNTFKLERKGKDKYFVINRNLLSDFSTNVVVVFYNKVDQAISPAYEISTPQETSDNPDSENTEISISLTASSSTLVSKSSTLSLQQPSSASNNVYDTPEVANPSSSASQSSASPPLPDPSSSQGTSSIAPETYKCCAGVNDNNQCCKKRDSTGTCTENEKDSNGSDLNYKRYNGYWIDTEGKACSQVSGYEYEVPKEDGGTKENCTKYEEYNRADSGCSAICNFDNLCPKSTYPD